MTNNIFVPQTFNGEQMVNVNVVNRKGGPSPNASTSSEPKKVVMPQVIPSEPVQNESEYSNKSGKGKAIAPAPAVNQTYVITNTTSPTPSTDERRVPPQKYWSEANIAMLIQLNRKYYNNGEVNWTQLAQEYNSITGEDRGLPSIITKWNILLKKYNAERSCMLQQQNSFNGKTSIPMVSYWNHFQYIDSYLSHTPILEDSLLSENDLDNNFENIVIPAVREGSRRKTTTQSNDAHNYTVMEQALKHQQSQIDLLQKNYETVSQMNLKFVELCEKITCKTQSNEARYLDLLEKYMNDKFSETIPRKRRAECELEEDEE
ncbi:unnamed protein product [Mucor hiemalis]